MGLAALLHGCSKHNAGGNNYFISFQSGSIQYSRVVDSLVSTTLNMEDSVVLISMSSFRTIAQTDSATAGLLTLATWELDLVNRSSPSTAYAGDYISDTVAGNLKWLESTSRFRFYTSSDPHKGQFIVDPAVPFSVSISQWNSYWFEGTFSGQVIQNNPTTGVTDTATITNGKFRLPVPR